MTIDLLSIREQDELDCLAQIFSGFV